MAFIKNNATGTGEEISAFLPDAADVLHQETYCRDADPAGAAHENRFSAGADQLDDIAVKADGRHCHDDEEFAEPFERIGN